MGAHEVAFFRSGGLELKQQILDLLPADWAFEGKRVLDFGCGAGRLLRHFLTEAESCEFHGCDIDAESIAWLQQYVCPPMTVFRNEETPPLPYDEETFDLILALSVFTHISDAWSAWLHELHRTLRPDGLVLATFLGPGVIETVGEAWDDDRIGMNVLRPLQGWELGGPMVFHSTWWLEEHWGRAFEFVLLRDGGFVILSAPQFEHGVALLRKKPVRITSEELERIDPAEPREVLALRHNIAQLGRESHAFQIRAAWLEAELARLEAERAALERAPRGSEPGS